MISNMTNNPGVDPNLGRVLEETVSVVRDLDERLRTLKLGISQAFPQLAPALQGTSGIGTTAPGLMGQMPFSPYATIPQQSGQIPGFTPFGVGLTQGLPFNAPFASGWPTVPLAYGQGITQGFVPQQGGHVNLGLQSQVPGFQSGIGAVGVGPYRGFL